MLKNPFYKMDKKFGSVKTFMVWTKTKGPVYSRPRIFLDDGQLTAREARELSKWLNEAADKLEANPKLDTEKYE